MILSSKDKYEKVFINKNSIYKSTKKIDIILSPEFYWVRKFEIPVENSKDAIKILPTLFEDIVSGENDYDYYAIHLVDNLYISFAYDSKYITNTLKNIGINISHINSIYFSQNEFLDKEHFKIDNNSYTYNHDILVKLPDNFINDFIDIKNDINLIKLSNHKIPVKFFSNFLNEKYINSIATFCLIIILINSFKYFDISKSIEKVYTKIESEKSINKLPTTLLQTNSIIKSLNKKISKEITFRNAIEYILQFKSFSKEGKIDKIEYSNSRIRVDFINVNSQAVKNYISKKYTILNDRTDNEYTKVEIKL